MHHAQTCIYIYQLISFITSLCIKMLVGPVEDVIIIFVPFTTECPYIIITYAKHIMHKLVMNEINLYILKQVCAWCIIQYGPLKANIKTVSSGASNLK